MPQVKNLIKLLVQQQSDADMANFECRPNPGRLFLPYLHSGTDNPLISSSFYAIMVKLHA
jgi:hypothetical protein